MYVEAVIYWLDENGECMLAFNLKRESKIIAIPQHEWTKNLIELKGSLCLAAILRRGEVITWILVRRKSKNQQEEEEVNGFLDSLFVIAPYLDPYPSSFCFMYKAKAKANVILMHEKKNWIFSRVTKFSTTTL